MYPRSKESLGKVKLYVNGIHTETAHLESMVEGATTIDLAKADSKEKEDSVKALIQK